MPRQEPGEPFFRINSEEAKQMLSDNSETAIIDVRNAEEYEGGHAQNATLIPHDQVLARFEELPKNKTLLLFSFNILLFFLFVILILILFLVLIFFGSFRIFISQCNRIDLVRYSLRVRCAQWLCFMNFRKSSISTTY